MAIFFFKVTLSLPTAFKAYGDMVKRTPCLVLRLLMRNSTGSPIFSDFQSDLSRVAVSRLLVKGNKDGWYEGCIVIVISSSDNNKLSSPLRQFFLFRNMREVKIQT